MSDSLQPHGLYSLWNSLGESTRVGSLSFLQGIFSTQELNQGLLHCRWILYQLSYQESPYCLMISNLPSVTFNNLLFLILYRIIWSRFLTWLIIFGQLLEIVYKKFWDFGWYSVSPEMHIFKGQIAYGHGLPRWYSGEESACQCRSRGFNPWVGKIP